MTRRIRFGLILGTAAGLCFGLPRESRAQQDTGPAVTVTAKSLNELADDLRYLATSVGSKDDPNVQQMLQGLDALSNPDNVPGIDRTKPFGAFASLPKEPGTMPSGAVFIPVTDGKKFLAFIGGNGVTVEDAGVPGFSNKITLPGGNVPPLFAVEGNGYLYFSIAPEGADDLKALKPAALRPNRAGAGDVSISIRLDRVPATFKEMFEQQFNQGLESQRERKPGEDDTAFMVKNSTMDLMRDAILALVKDGKELALDLVIEPKTEFVGLDLNSSAVAGSGYAKGLAKLSGMKSRTRGLTSNSAALLSAAIPVPAKVRETFAKVIDQGRAEALKKAKADSKPTKPIEELFDAIRETISAETMDASVAIQGPYSAAGGELSYGISTVMAVKQGKELESAFREGAKLATNDEKVKVELDAAKAPDGTSIHKMTNTEPAPPPINTKTIFFAFRDDVAVFSIGEKGQEAVLQALSSSKTAKPVSTPIEATIAAGKAAGLNPNKAVSEAYAKAAAEVFVGPAKDKDHMTLLMKSQGDSMTIRVGFDVPSFKYFAMIGRMNK